MHELGKLSLISIKKLVFISKQAARPVTLMPLLLFVFRPLPEHSLREIGEIDENYLFDSSMCAAGCNSNVGLCG
jgi:hypothetical protein